MLTSAGALAFNHRKTLFAGDRKVGLFHAFDFSDLIVDQASFQLGRK